MIKKKFIVNGLIFTLVFGIAAGGTYFLVPQRIIEGEGGSETGEVEPDDPIAVTGIERLMNSTVASLTSGIEVDFNKLRVDIAGKDSNPLYTNHLIADNANLMFSMSELSVHGINLSLEAPVAYQVGAVTKNRGLDLKLIQDNIYFDIYNADSADKWDFKYHVSTATVDVPGAGIDEHTGGTFIYEMGELSWVLEDILDVLTEGGVQISFPSLSTLIKGDNAASESEEESQEEEQEEKSGLDLDSIMASMDSMQEYNLDNNACHYFVWNLEISDELTLPLGLKADANYNLSGVDFPAKNISESSTSYASLTQGEFEFPNSTISISVSADVKTSNSELVWSIPSDAASYRDLSDSLGLFKGIAALAATPKFGIDGNISINHHVEGEEATETTLAQDEIDETANIALNADVDFSSYKLNALSVGLDISTADDENTVYSTGLSAKMFGDEEGNEAYVNVGNVLKAHATKSTVDALMGKIKGSNKNDQEGQAQEQVAEESTSALLDTIKKIEDIKNILDSDMVKGIKEGHYEWALDMLDVFRNDDNFIEVVLSFAPLGIVGKATVTLDGHDNASLLSISIEDLTFASLTVNADIALTDFTDVTVTEEEQSEYLTMTHLVGTVDQIQAFTNTKQGKLSIGASVLKEGTSDVGGHLKGIELTGSAAFDLNVKQATASIKLEEFNTSWRQDHTVNMDLTSNNGGDLDKVLFSYSSYNELIESDEENDNLYNRTNPTGIAKEGYQNTNGVKGYLSIASISDLVDSLTSFFGEADHRFSRVMKSLQSETETSLMSKLTSGNYFAIIELLEDGILKEVNKVGDTTTFVVKGSTFGMNSDITIAIEFDPNATDEDGNVTEGGINNLTISLALGKEEGKMTNVEITLGGIESELDENDKLSSFELADFEAETLEAAGFVDYTSIFNLVDYAIGTTMIGAPVNGGVSTFAIEASVSLVLGEYVFDALKVKAGVYVHGAKVKAYLELNELPVIKGINGPEDSHYFRSFEYEGMRDVAMYYYADGFNPKGYYLLTRDSTYGRLAHVKDSLFLTGAEFNEHPAEYLLQYLIGVNSEFFETEEASEQQEQTTQESSSSILKHAMHAEDFLKSYLYSFNNGNPSWDINIDLGAMLGLSFLGVANLHLGGTRVAYEKDGEIAYFKGLNNLSVDLGIALAGKLKVCSASVDASITNLHDGVYTDGWAFYENTFQTYFSSAVRANGVGDYGYLNYNTSNMGELGYNLYWTAGN